MLPSDERATSAAHWNKEKLDQFQHAWAAHDKTKMSHELPQLRLLAWRDGIPSGSHVCDGGKLGSYRDSIKLWTRSWVYVTFWRMDKVHLPLPWGFCSWNYLWNGSTRLIRILPFVQTTMKTMMMHTCGWLCSSIKVRGKPRPSCQCVDGMSWTW